MTEPAGLAVAGAAAGGAASPVGCGSSLTARLRLAPVSTRRATSIGLSVATGEAGAVEADSSSDQVPNEGPMERVLAVKKLGTSVTGISATSAAAMPTGTSHGILYWRGRERRGGRINSFGATVLNRCSR